MLTFRAVNPHPAPPAWGPPPPLVAPPGYQEPPAQGTNGYAIASLIFGIIGGVLFGIGFGILALKQIRRRPQAGRGLAIAGLVLSGVWFVVIAGAAVTGALAGEKENRAVAEGVGTVNVLYLKPGHCVGTLEETARIEDLALVPCSQPHAVEVFATFDLPAGPWPGDAALQDLSDKGCTSRLKGYAPTAPDSLDVFYLSPLQSAWGDDRGVTCLVGDPAGRTTGSIRD